MNIIADITLTDVQQWIPMITALLVVAFDWGILYSKIKTFTTKDDVGKIVDEKLKGHCPNTLRLRDLDLSVAELENWKHEHMLWGQKSNEETHLALQELRYNLKALCKKMDVEYQNGDKK